MAPFSRAFGYRDAAMATGKKATKATGARAKGSAAKPISKPKRAKANQSHGQTAPGKTLLLNSGKALAPVDTAAEVAKTAGVSRTKPAALAVDTMSLPTGRATGRAFTFVDGRDDKDLVTLAAWIHDRDGTNAELRRYVIEVVHALAYGAVAADRKLLGKLKAVAVREMKLRTEPVGATWNEADERYDRGPHGVVGGGARRTHKKADEMRALIAAVTSAVQRSPNMTANRAHFVSRSVAAQFWLHSPGIRDSMAREKTFADVLSIVEEVTALALDLDGVDLRTSKHALHRVVSPILTKLGVIGVDDLVQGV